MKTDRGDWITTYTGIKFHVNNIADEDISVEDIAHALSLTCRFGGHCSEFYSVAQHSVLLSRVVPQEHAMAALFHDAAEAYLTDVPAPIKKYVTGFSELEDKILSAIAKKFGFAFPLNMIVKSLDKRILADEARVLIKDISWIGEGVGVKVRPWSGYWAERTFLDRWNELR